MSKLLFIHKKVSLSLYNYLFEFEKIRVSDCGRPFMKLT
jgi:hypothetical protein